MQELTPTQRQVLKGRAHSLNPVVSISQNGLSESVIKEIDRTLKAHELIKIRVYGAERDVRDILLKQVCEAVGALPVQHIGNILVVFRPKPEETKSAAVALANRKVSAKTGIGATLQPRRRLTGTKPASAPRPPRFSPNRAAPAAGRGRGR